MQSKWNVLIIPTTAAKGYNFSLSARALKLVASALVLLLVASVAICAHLASSWKSEHIKVVKDLEDELSTRETEIDSLTTEFTTLLTLEEKLRTIAGLKPRQTSPGESEEGGKGGPALSEAILFTSATDIQGIGTTDPDKLSTDALLEAIAATRDSFEEICEALEQERERLSSIPSINPVSHPDAWISSGYGYRKDPLNGHKRFHEGTDIVAPRGTTVMAPADGVVTFAGWHDGLGRALELRHGYGYRTTYGHNEKLLVKRGDSVKRGDAIALLGSSGRSTGPHLHYEVRLNGKLQNPYRYVIE